MITETLRWMFPTAQVAWLIAAWLGGAVLLSWALNGQRVRQKLLNMARAAGILLATASWFSVLRIVHHEPTPFRSFGVIVAIFVCVTAGDWIAFGLYHLVDQMDMRTWMRAQVKAGMVPPAQKKQFDWLGIMRGWPPNVKRTVLVMLAAILAALACSVNSVVNDQAPLSDAQDQIVDAVALVGAQDTGVCPTQPVVICVAVTATPQASIPAPTATPSTIPTRTAVPTATRTPAMQATPTQQPPGTPIFGTNVPATPFCAWEVDGAQPADKQTFYTYTDPQFSGLLQRVRGGPGTGTSIVDYLSKGVKTRVYWSIYRGGYTWWALDVGCSKWAAQLGSIVIEN